MTVPARPRVAGSSGLWQLRRQLWPFGIVASLWFLVVGCAVGQWVLFLMNRWPLDVVVPATPAHFASVLVVVVLAGVGGLVVLRGDSPRYGWLMLYLGVALGLTGLSGLYSLVALATAAPLSLPAVWVQDLWMTSQMLGFLLLPALFPDGRTASRRWRLPVRLATTAWMVLIVLFVSSDRPATNVYLGLDDPPANPTGFLPIPMEAFNIVWAVLVLTSVVIGIGSLVTRWRRAELELRQRFKWMLYAFGLWLTVAGLNLVNTVLGVEGIDLGLSYLLDLLSSAAFVGLAVALGFAVLRFRLYDVDLVINRTIVYGVLTIGVISLYVVVVVGIGALLPVGETILALLASGVAAVAFAPLRDRLQRLVNQWMFGRRDDPYGVLADMSRLMTEAGTSDEILQTLAETVARSLKLPGAAIELERDGVWTPRAAFGDVSADEGVLVSLRHRDEAVGRLVVMPRSSHESLSPKDMALLEDIAHPAGAIAHSVRLSLVFQRSRENLVLAREEERRRIRRDLHDGLGPALASQTFQLDEIMETIHENPDRAVALASDLKTQNQQLMADIRSLVYELRPPTLDELGVAGAIRAQVRQLDRSTGLRIEVETVPDPLPDLPAAVEVAAYRITREAITNTIRHSSATRCTARLEAAADSLTISVRDNGKGMSRFGRPGVGLVSMRERCEELGGTFEARSSGRSGTEIVAVLPILNEASSG